MIAIRRPLCVTAILLAVLGFASLPAMANGPAYRFLSGGVSPYSLFELQLPSPNAIEIGPASFNPGLDVDPMTGILYGANDRLRTINTTDGSYVEIGPVHTDTISDLLLMSIAFDPQGQLYGVSGDPDNNTLYSIDKTTAAATPIGVLPGGPGNAAWGIDFAPNGTLYGAATSLQIINPVDASVLSTIGAIDVSVAVLDIDFAPDGNLYALNFGGGVSNQLLRVDLTDASVAILAAYPGDYWGLASEVIPEPASLALLGLGGLALLRRRRN